MSTAMKQFTDEISDQFLVCKICFETYKRPKTLSCLHTFCTSCLEKYLHAELERTQYRYVIYARCITCPVCRKRTEIPSGGVKELPDNFLVSNLTEVVNRSKPAERSSMCDFCTNSGRASKVALSHCVECNKNMCRNCTELHKRTRVTRTHSLFDVKAEKNVVCKIHQDEPLRFFCQPCETCICVACTFREHHGHEVASFGEGISKYADDMEAMTNLCMSKMSAIQAQLDVINKFEKDMEKVEEQIKSVASNLIVQIRMKQRQMLDDIRHFYGSEALELLDNKEELEQIMENLSTTCDLAQIVLKDRNVELLLLHKEVREKLKTLIDFELPDVPDSMFKSLKFVHGALFFGYLDMGQDVQNLEYDVKPSPLLHPEILKYLSKTSCFEETQTSNDNIRDNGTTMNTDIVYGWPSQGSQTDEVQVDMSRRGTQTEAPQTKTTSTETESTVCRSRAQNTERRDSLIANCGSQTNVGMIDALSECHPVLACQTVKMSDAETDTGILTANFGTTTQDLETELINKYLEMLDNDDHSHSPPYNIPFPVDIFDRNSSPTYETTSLMRGHILNAVQKEDRGTNVPTVNDITNGREIEFMDVMLKDSSTDTDDLLPKFQFDPAYNLSDSYGSSPDDTENSSESSNRSSDEERFTTDQGTLIDKDDLLQILAGEELVQWDERSALYDMIVLDQLNTKRNLEFIDSAMNTEAVPLASRSIMTDTLCSRTVATLTVANITVDAATSARVRGPRQDTIGTLTDTLDMTDTGSDAFAVEMSDFGVDMRPEMVDSTLQNRMVHSTSKDSDFVSSPDTPTTEYRRIPERVSDLRRRSSAETGELTEKLQGLFSMSKLQALTKKLERRPSQNTGMVEAVARKLERKLSGDFDLAAKEALADFPIRKPPRRWSTTTSSPTTPIRQTPLTGVQRQVNPHGSPKMSPKPFRETGITEQYRFRCELPDGASYLAPDDLPLAPRQNQPSKSLTTGARKQLARVRRPDITALLSLNTTPLGEWGSFLNSGERPKRPADKKQPPKFTFPKAPAVSATDERNVSSTSSQTDASSDMTSSDFTSSDLSSTSSTNTPILSPFTDESQSPVAGRSGTATPTGQDLLDINLLESRLQASEVDVIEHTQKEVIDDDPRDGARDEQIFQVEELTMPRSHMSQMVVEDQESDGQRCAEAAEPEKHNTSDSDGQSDEEQLLSAIADHNFASCDSPVEEREIDEGTDKHETKFTPGTAKQEDEQTETAGPCRSNHSSDASNDELTTATISHYRPLSEDMSEFEANERLFETTIETSPTIEVPIITAQLPTPEDSTEEETHSIQLEDDKLLLEPPPTQRDWSSDMNASPTQEKTCSTTTNPSFDLQITEPTEHEYSCSASEPVMIEYDDFRNPLTPDDNNTPVYLFAPTPFESDRPQTGFNNGYSSPNTHRHFTFDEHYLTLPSLSESQTLDDIPTYRSLSPRPKMGKLYNTKKYSDTLVRPRTHEEPGRVVLGVSGIRTGIPRSKSLNTINSEPKSPPTSPSHVSSTKSEARKSLSKAFQSIFKSSKSGAKDKRNSSYM